MTKRSSGKNKRVQVALSPAAAQQVGIRWPCDDETTNDMPLSRIYFIRGKKVMLDRDLAELYGMTTRDLYQVVKRKLRHFPHDFMFPLTYEEVDALPFSIGRVKKTGRRRRYPPRVFTEQGVAMLSSILHKTTPVYEVTPYKSAKSALAIDEQKIDETALALLYLTLHDGCQVWKSLDWQAMTRLHEKGLIEDPVNKAKSLVLTGKGLTEAERLFKALFVKE